MSSNTLYPDDNGQIGLYQGKFSNGDAKAGIKPSRIPAGHLNLLTDILEQAIRGAGLVPDNAESAVDQLKRVFEYYKTKIESDASSKDSNLRSSLITLINQAKREAKIEAKNELYPIGSIYINYNNSRNPSSLLGFGTWTALPVNYFLAQAGNRYSAGGTYSEGLPNIIGSFDILRLNPEGNRIYTVTGAVGSFSATTSPSHGSTLDVDNAPQLNRIRVNINASRSSAIYGRASYVQPYTLGAYMWRRIA